MENSDSDVPNRRRAQRPKSFKSGKMIFGGFNAAVVDCLILELTETGARIETSVMMMVPETLTLRFSDGSDHAMRRVWARGNEIGLAFLPGA